MVNRADGGPALKHAMVVGVNRCLPVAPGPCGSVFHNLLWISGLGPPDLEGWGGPSGGSRWARSIGVARHRRSVQPLESPAFSMTPCAAAAPPDSTCIPPTH